MKLSDIQIKSSKPTEKPYKLSDGEGMYLLIKPNGSKLWQLKYRFLNKEKTLSIGQYPLISLKEARDKKVEAKKLLLNNQDPSQVKKAQKEELKRIHENTFESIAREWHKNNLHTWKQKHADSILKRFEKNLFPSLGKIPIKEIRPPELLKAVEKVQNRGNHDLAHRTMQMCSKVFRFGVARGLCERDITVDLKGALKPVKSKSNPYLSEKELPEFLSRLDRYEEYGGKALVKYAFQFMILTFVRTGEIRFAKWDEIDFEKEEWRIPGERMKMKEAHIVPLSKQSIKLLREIHQITGDNSFDLIFPSQREPSKPISENTFLRAIDVLGYKGKTTGHGFRSTASTILNEKGFNKDAIERQLSHGERDQIRAAYNYAEYLPERREMMNWWSGFIEAKGALENNN